LSDRQEKLEEEIKLEDDEEKAVGLYRLRRVF
jgi:hypothetical protein